ncbi:hypothetical protein [Alteromonas lipolytica]|uniref:Citrate transporter-like domain-containing protein n=1 Tax=Alteromonas lipolytica TaxID=1856405 RepID=A0A1E8F8S7_9ALTE|nr:hypothetical protein [Alteromonas lipolytica]OFI32315.1 hypothetical protein BFC17_07640 [Alteromonas lipolytica]GGF85537.1 hypothetical protein GCM10011338_42350 [Alteromonas lipolytica]
MRFAFTHYAGWLATFTLLTYLLSVAGLIPAQIATVLAWITLGAMVTSVKKSALRQSGILFGLGVCGLFFGYLQGAEVNWQSVFAANVPLLTMFVAISFLSLTNPVSSEEALPTGNKAAATTAMGTTLLGAVINMSVLFVFGDRLKRHGTLTDAQQIVLARSFTAAAWWSPFFIATGVALMYSPGMVWTSTVLPGTLMALMGIGYTLLDVKRRETPRFEGYPLQPGSLAIPVLMAIAVLVLHELFPTVKIMVLISCLSVISAILFIQQRPRAEAVKSFIDNRLHSAGPQFALFLAAGVFSAGIKTLISLYPELVDLHEYQFDASLFGVICALMILAGLLGVHPVISIAVVSPLLLPLDPNPTSLGFMFLTTWAVSTGAGPLSGIGMILTGRYGASARNIIRNNWHYVVVMWALASLVNGVFIS